MFIEVLAFSKDATSGQSPHTELINTNFIMRVESGHSFSSGPSLLIHFTNGDILRVVSDFYEADDWDDVVDKLKSLT